MRRGVAGSVRRMSCGWWILVFTALIGVGEAQEVAPTLEDWVRAGDFRPEERIYVTDVEGRRWKVRVREVAAGRLSATEDGRVLSWRRDEVASIEAGDSLVNGMLIGAAIGVGSFLMRCRDGSHESGICPWPLAVISPFYGVPLPVTGALLGALFDAHITRTVYRGDGGGRAAVGPRLSTEGAGVELSLEW